MPEMLPVLARTAVERMMGRKVKTVRWTIVIECNDNFAPVSRDRTIGVPRGPGAEIEVTSASDGKAFQPRY